MESSSKVFSPSSKESKKSIALSKPGQISPKSTIPALNLFSTSSDSDTCNSLVKDPEFDRTTQAQFNLCIGQIKDGMAKLYTDTLESIELPLSLLPSDIHVGNIIKLAIIRDKTAENERRNFIKDLQESILSKGDNL